jgi:hypothetical protein
VPLGDGVLLHTRAYAEADALADSEDARDECEMQDVDDLSAAYRT